MQFCSKLPLDFRTPIFQAEPSEPEEYALPEEAHFLR